MKKVYVKVDYQILLGGVIRPVVIHWYDGRTWAIKKTLHICTSGDDFEGIRYTVLIENEEKYLYRIGDKWYVESILTEVEAV